MATMIRRRARDGCREGGVRRNKSFPWKPPDSPNNFEDRKSRLPLVPLRSRRGRPGVAAGSAPDRVGLRRNGVGRDRPVNTLRYLLARLRFAWHDWRVDRMMRRAFGLSPAEVRAVLRRMP